MHAAARIAGVTAVFVAVSAGMFVWPTEMLRVVTLKAEGWAGLGALAIGLIYVLFWFAVPVLVVAALLSGTSKESEALRRAISVVLTVMLWIVGFGLPAVIVGSSVGSTTSQFVMSCLKALSLFLLILAGKEVIAWGRSYFDRTGQLVTMACTVCLLGLALWSVIAEVSVTGSWRVAGLPFF